MRVDSFKYLPRLIASFYQMSDRQPEHPIPWTPLPRPLSECKFGLVSTAGLYQIGVEPPFDLEREKTKPTWGDPTYRKIPFDIDQADVGVAHLHMNARDVTSDINILLPIHRFQELAVAGRIGSIAPIAFSFMGYQGFPPDTSSWREHYAPETAKAFLGSGVDCVLLTPA